MSNGPVADLIYQGGPFMWPILILLVLTPLWSMLLAVLGIARFRVPAFLWWCPALLACLIGALGTVIGQHQAIQAIAFASPETQGALAAAGHSTALTTRVAGNFVGSAILFGTVLCAALAVSACDAQPLEVATLESAEAPVVAPAPAASSTSAPGGAPGTAA